MSLQVPTQDVNLDESESFTFTGSSLLFTPVPDADEVKPSRHRKSKSKSKEKSSKKEKIKIIKDTNTTGKKESTTSTTVNNYSNAYSVPRSNYLGDPLSKLFSDLSNLQQSGIPIFFGSHTTWEIKKVN